jgi:hypothetical protein
MIDLPWITLLSAALIVTLAYAVFGLTGFGAVIVGLPLLAHFFPLRFAVPMMLVFDLCISPLLGLKNHRLMDKRELLRLLPFLLLGMVAGVTLLASVPERWLLLVLGSFVLSYAGWSLLAKTAPTIISPRWAVAAGTVGGAFTAMYGTGGPIYVIYLARRLADSGAMRATISALVFGTALFRLVLFTSSGFYAHDHLLTLSLALLPCALAGYLIGSHLHTRISMRRAAHAIWLVLIVGGASLLWRSLKMM